MSIKTTLATGVTVIALAAGATQMLTTSPADHEAQRREQQVQDLADADERSKAAQKDSGDAAAEADRKQKLKPVVPTAKPKVKPRIRIRIP